MPILNSILDHEVLGREFKRGLQEGELTVLRRQIEKRFGALPSWAEGHLAGRTTTELLTVTEFSVAPSRSLYAARAASLTAK